MSEIQKAYEDMVMFGTGVIEVKEDEIKHVPIVEEDPLTYDKVQKSLKFFTDFSAEGDVIFYDGETGETHKGHIPKRNANVVAMNELKPTNRKQRRIQASKQRRKR